MKQITVDFGTYNYKAEESFKTLRTNIMLSGVENKVIALTSCTPNEGKSTLSLALAKSLAESGKSVLLIDADLRKSILAGRVQVKDEVKGLSHFLSGLAEANDVLCRTQEEKLFIIMAGIVPPNPAELLGQKRFEALLASARKIYDYIIIDTPPLGSVIDAAVIARVCDGTVLVISAGEISYKFVRVVKDQLDKTRKPILGVILNRAEMDGGKYYSRYYSKYYSSYYSRYYGNYGEYGHSEKSGSDKKKSEKRSEKRSEKKK